MARRTSLSEEETGTLIELVEVRISESNSADIDVMAPLYRMRDKLLSMKAGRSDKARTPKPKAEKPAKSARSTTQPITFADGLD